MVLIDTTTRLCAVALLLVIASGIGLPCAAQKLPRVIERDVCEGEGCDYGLVRAGANIAVYDRDSDSATIQFFIRWGEGFMTLTSHLHHEPPGSAVLTESLTIESLDSDPIELAFKAGDTIMILGYRGEGVHGIQWRGRIYDVVAFWSDPYRSPMREKNPAKLVREPVTTTWYKIRTGDGAEGWIRWRPFLFYDPMEM
jgi:hypothetical protein